MAIPFTTKPNFFCATQEDAKIDYNRRWHNVFFKLIFFISRSTGDRRQCDEQSLLGCPPWQCQCPRCRSHRQCHPLLTVCRRVLLSNRTIAQILIYFLKELRSIRLPIQLSCFSFNFHSDSFFAFVVLRIADIFPSSKTFLTCSLNIFVFWLFRSLLSPCHSIQSP